MEKKSSTPEYEILSELPGNVIRVVYIPNEGPGVGRDGVIVRFSPSNGAPWIGIFAFGDHGICKVYPGPGRSNLITVVARGEAYIANPSDPSSFFHVKSSPVINTIPVPSRNLILFHDYTEIIAYNERGLAWETKRISWDGIEIDEVNDDVIIGKSWDAPNERTVMFRVDLTNGHSQGGSSPPE